MRPKLRSLLCLFSSAVLLSGCSLNIFGQKSGIQITANPQVEVTLNGQNLGKTPIFQDSTKPGSYSIRMTPLDSNFEPWEDKITLTSGAYTVVDRQFGKTPDQSSSYILSFEKLSDKNRTEVTIVSNPANVSVSVDGNPSGFSGSALDSVPAGDHTFTFSTPGFQEKIVRAKVQSGFRLVINLTMATQTIIPTPTPTPIATPSATPKPTSGAGVTPLPKQSTGSATLAKPYVEILNTPTGWLKVREEPSVNAAELAKVNPGDKFPYQEASASGWFKIEYLTGKYGFVSSQYSKLVK